MNTSFFEILVFQFSSLPDGHYIPPHLHHFHQLDVILAGRVAIEIEGRAPLVGIAGQAWLIPPLVRHAYHAQENFYQATFKLQLAPRYWKVFGRKFHHFEVRQTLTDEAKSVAASHLHHKLLALPQATAIATLCMAQCADDIQKTISESDVENHHTDLLRDRLWPLMERIESQPYAPWTVPEVAEECCLSPDYFSTCFARVIGQTFQGYLREVRMRAAAADLLAAPSRPIKEIAARTNYATVHSFSRAFKCVFGAAPAAYRKMPHDV